MVGVADWSPESLTPPNGPMSIWAAGIGASAIFVSYEGFQLLTYDYDEIKDPETLTPVLVWGSVAVIGVYVLVAFGATMIVGADTVLERETVALAVAAEHFAEVIGLIIMTVAAAFATSAAINSTLFSTAQLATRVADDGELPAWFYSRNDSGVPARAVVVIAAAAAVLAVLGSLSGLVEAASLVFLVAFGGRERDSDSKQSGIAFGGFRCADHWRARRIDPDLPTGNDEADSSSDHRCSHAGQLLLEAMDPPEDSG